MNGRSFPPRREERTDAFRSVSKKTKGSESPNSYLDQESRRRCTIADYDKPSVGCPIEANVILPRLREQKSSRGQWFSFQGILEIFHQWLLEKVMTLNECD